MFSRYSTIFLLSLLHCFSGFSEEILSNDEDTPLVVKRENAFGDSIDVSCALRFTPGQNAKPGAKLTLLAEDGKDNVSITATRREHGYVIVAAGKQFVLNLKPYPLINPLWPETTRIPLIRDMAEAPGIETRWLQLKCRITGDKVRLWADGQFIAEVCREEIRPTGAELTISKGVEARHYQILPMKQANALFEPLVLDGIVRDRTILEDSNSVVRTGSLPFGEETVLEGVPFRFADRSITFNGADHLDVGRSILRQDIDRGDGGAGTRVGYAGDLDPARMRLSIPNGRYESMYVVAAFDEEENSIPVMSSIFYRPRAGYSQVFESKIPSFMKETDDNATPLPVELESGRTGRLWLVKIKLDPAMLASFSDMQTLEMEITKTVHQFRSYPDPQTYGWHQGGLPSGVHVYAITLERPAVHMALEPEVFGHVWQKPDHPAYKIELHNRSRKDETVTLAVRTESYNHDETHTQERTVELSPGEIKHETFIIQVEQNGIHRITAAMDYGDNKTWVEERNLCSLAPDTRATQWEDGKGPLFGWWGDRASYHYTPDARETLRLMTMAGARATTLFYKSQTHKYGKKEELTNTIKKYDLHAGPCAQAVSVEQMIDLADSNKIEDYVIDRIKRIQGDTPDLFSMFWEPYLSRDLTMGNLPSYYGDPEYVMNEEEREKFTRYFKAAQAAAEIVRKTFPETKIVLPWGDPLFIVPFLRNGFPLDLIDGCGLDVPGFERLPEQQLHQISLHRLYMLKREFAKAGKQNPFLAFVEGAFVPTLPGACTYTEQAAIYSRWKLISLAYGVTRFYSGWVDFDLASYYGSGHYGANGVFRRIPYCDPKPAYSAFAVMTRMLDQANFDSWLSTGSHSTYCLKFVRANGESVYALWTLRGKRPVTLSLDSDADVMVTDIMDNSKTVSPANKQCVVMTSATPVYITVAGNITDVRLGPPDHSEAATDSRNRNRQSWHTGPLDRDENTEHTETLTSLGDGSWKLSNQRDELYEQNNFDTKRFLGNMSTGIVEDEDRKGQFLAVKLGKQDKDRKVMPYYSVLKPDTPVVIPGKSKALGVWVKANSDWGRIIYTLSDAKGERWTSIGTKDQWNCDDIHSWSSFNFDGWRYLRFELPSNTAYDSFREYGTTWWGHRGGDGIVDLPLRIEEVIVERRTHILYVNDIQPANTNDTLLGKIIAEYETEFDATEKAIERNRIRMQMPDVSGLLDNPISEMGTNIPEATTLIAVKDPDWYWDGTRCKFFFDEVKGAVKYQVWLSKNRTGKGARLIKTLKESGELVTGLRPEVALYFWLTYVDSSGAQSKPSNRLEVTLVDSFGFK